MNRRLTGVLVSLALLGSLCGCHQQKNEVRKERLTVFVSILPLAYFAEQLGQEQVRVEVLVGPGHSPATYEPSPRQLTKLARAALLFRVGVPFERALLSRLQGLAPKLTIVDTRQGIKLLSPPHGHGHPAEEPPAAAAGAATADQPAAQRAQQAAHSEADPHVWLDPHRVRQLVRTMAQALIRHDPEHAALYRARLARLEKELSALDRELASRLAPLAGRRLFVFHGAYAYFCQRYQLVQVSLEQEGKESGAKQLAHFITQARKDQARALFVQPQYSRREAEAVARSIGAKVITLDPLSRRYPADLRLLAATIQAQLAPAPTQQGARP